MDNLTILTRIAVLRIIYPICALCRYHCFSCDFTLCSDCARDIEAVLGQVWGDQNTGGARQDPQNKLIVFYP